MSELFDYGVTSANTTYGLTPSKIIPPIAYFETSIDLLYDKIMTVVSQTNSLFYDRSLGCAVDEYIFETASEETVERLKQVLYDSLVKNIDNINISSIDIEQKVVANGYVEYDVTIVVKLNSTDYSFAFTLTKSGVQT